MGKLTLDDVGKFWTVGAVGIILTFAGIILLLKIIVYVLEGLIWLTDANKRMILEQIGIAMLFIMIPILIGFVILKVYHWYDDNYRSGLKDAR